MRHWFKTPISIWESSTTRRKVTSVEEAARLILDEWPDGDVDDAAKAILAALEGGPIDAAADAFREAAKRAGILAD